MHELILRQLTKSFGQQPVLHDLNLEVQAGELLVVVGESGCGKTTLLRLIAGLEKAETGQIEMGGQLVDRVPPHLRDVGMVFQDLRLYPHMTVRQNLEFVMEAGRVARPDMSVRIGELAEILSLQHLLDRKPDTLSGGEQQRVAIARAWVRKPRVLLLDEPYSQLDPHRRKHLIQEFARLHRHEKTTTIYVTHAPQEALSLGDRIAVMAHGKFIQVDTPEAIFQQPSNQYVAEFFGAHTLNLVTAHVKYETSDSITLAFKDVIWRLPRRLELIENKQVILGLRGELLRLRSPTAGECGMRVSIQSRRYQGSDAVIAAVWHEQILELRIRRDDLEVQQGDSMELAIPADQVLLFDSESKALLR